MSIAYQYDASGYFAGTVEDHGLLPNNATHTPAPEQQGFIARWKGTAWEQVENHRGEEGYKDGAPFTITEYGPYPAGWSVTAPEPTPEEKAKARIDEIDTAIRRLEQKVIRPLLAVSLNMDEAADRERQKELASEILALRAERRKAAVLLQ